MAVAEDDIPSPSMALVPFGQCGGVGRSWIFLHIFVVRDTVIEESPPGAVRAQRSIANGHHSAGSENLPFLSGQKIGGYVWIHTGETSSRANKLQFEDCV